MLYPYILFKEKRIFIGKDQWYKNFVMKVFDGFTILQEDQNNATEKDVIIWSFNAHEFDGNKAFKIFIDGEPWHFNDLKTDVIITTKKDKSLLPDPINTLIIYVPLYSICFSDCGLSPYVLLDKVYYPKNKFCAYAYTNCNINFGNVRARENFFDILNKLKTVDVLGTCHGSTPLENINKITDTSSTQGWIQNLELFKPYKFVICFENSFVDGYITEKLVMPMLCGAIPIYMGSNDISEHINIKSIINGRDYESLEELAKDVINIDNNDERYQNILKERWLDKLSSHFDWFTDPLFIEKILKIVNSFYKVTS